MKKIKGIVLLALAILVIAVLPASAMAAKPDPPQGFKGEARSTTASFSWNSSAGAAKYELYEISSSGNKATFIGSTKKVSMTIKNMEPENTYRFAIRAVDPNGKASGWSNIITIRTTKRMAAPKNVSAKRSADGTSYTVTWDEEKDARKYQVFKVEKDGKTTYLGSAVKNSFTHQTTEITVYCVRCISEYGDEGELGVQRGASLSTSPRIDTNPKPTPRTAQNTEPAKDTLVGDVGSKT